MTVYEIIEKKRDRGTLSKEEISWFIKNYCEDKIPDYQASALLMAIFLQGMSDDELFDLTKAMLDSGEKLDLSAFDGKTVDKHSTGGVGDKTTLIVAPIVATLGGKVAKMSGRGLGHTGGTIDKLESIPNFKTRLTNDEFITQTQRIGVAVIESSMNMVPADKKIYALRDVTATINSKPLIASSIMSKKLAAGADSIVLDVKVGSGSFMKTIDKATALAEAMIDIGYNFGKKVIAVITDMDSPLGNNIGNACEVKEAAEFLKGKGDSRLREVCIILAANMLSMANGWSMTYALSRVQDAINNGSAYAKFLEWIAAQGGDTSVFEDLDNFAKPKFTHNLIAQSDGYINSIDAEKLGKAAVLLGAGRITKSDKIDYTAGITLCVKVGDKVEKGQTLATLYSSQTNDFSEVDSRCLSAFVIADKQGKEIKSIYKIIAK